MQKFFHQTWISASKQRQRTKIKQIPNSRYVSKQLITKVDYLFNEAISTIHSSYMSTAKKNQIEKAAIYAAGKLLSKEACKKPNALPPSYVFTGNKLNRLKRSIERARLLLNWNYVNNNNKLPKKIVKKVSAPVKIPKNDSKTIHQSE